MSHLVRPATPADLDTVAEIYDHEVRTGISTFDVEPPPIGYWEARLASVDAGDHMLVTEVAGQVLGYAYSSAYRPRQAYARTWETSIDLAADARGRGLGRALYGALLIKAAEDGVHTVVALVATPNPASEALHLAYGFRHLGTMAEVGFKFGRWVNTAWYERRLTQPRS
jgi:L-amino acid N-acyltransferase YncA